LDIPVVFKQLKPCIEKVLQDPQLANTNITVSCKTLSTQEAIGSPGRDDFPLQKGKEKLMQAMIDGFAGQAFTDMPGNFNGTLQEALTLIPHNNFNRAVIVAALNALFSKTGKAFGTIHCKDTGPRECSLKLAEHISTEYGNPRIAVVGLQPAIVEQLARRFEIRVFDLDPENIGQEKCGVLIENGACGPEELEKWCDLFLVTGSTVANGTIVSFLSRSKPVLFYGTTIAAVAEILGLKRFCPMSS
jgi:uncharacterized protein (DUF4213/DUF364 family)